MAGRNPRYRVYLDGPSNVVFFVVRGCRLVRAQQAGGLLGFLSAGVPCVATFSGYGHRVLHHRKAPTSPYRLGTWFHIGTSQPPRPYKVEAFGDIGCLFLRLENKGG